MDGNSMWVKHVWNSVGRAVGRTGGSAFSDGTQDGDGWMGARGTTLITSETR